MNEIDEQIKEVVMSELVNAALHSMCVRVLAFHCHKRLEGEGSMDDAYVDRVERNIKALVGEGKLQYYEQHGDIGGGVYGLEDHEKLYELAYKQRQVEYYKAWEDQVKRWREEEE